MNTIFGLTYQVSEQTKENGDRKSNQDCVSNIQLDEKCLMLITADGHGRALNIDFGRFFSQYTVDYAKSYFSEHISELHLNPLKVIEDFFDRLNESIEKYVYENLDKRIFELSDNIVVNKYTKNPISGGTTCTIILFIDNSIYSANVGDSSAFLVSTKPVLADVKPLRIDLATSQNVTDILQTFSSEYLIELSTDTPCDSKYERDRIIQYDDPVNFIYDSCNRTERELIFNQDGTKKEVPKNIYNKNVRKDIATLIKCSTGECLAMTRSIGDYNIHKHGGTHKPVISHIENFSNLLEDGNILSIICATDGVWDNWLYPDVQSFLMHDSCLNILFKEDDGVNCVSKSFLDRNQIYAKRNFGISTDDASFVLAYFKKEVFVDIPSEDSKVTHLDEVSLNNPSEDSKVTHLDEVSLDNY
jgi:serine/threonine protein phosphatase PrpC